MAPKLDLEEEVGSGEDVRATGHRESINRGRATPDADLPGFNAHLPGEARELKHLRTQDLIHIIDLDLILTARSTRWAS